MFNNVYLNKKILITGASGFKGSWLSLWLISLGAHVLGYSLEPDTNPSMFKELKIEKNIRNVFGNILDTEKLEKTINDYQPDIVFHLAAQPLVRLSYSEPLLTYQTNVIGTLNVLEAARKTNSIKAFVNITTDKCYENKEIARGYKEDEPMGGYDMYSSSKGCVEIMSSSYRRSFLKEGYAMATARAGNVIGGGDWSADRLVPDCIKSIINSEKINIRNPESTRPWQHVLEPLSGYLRLGQLLMEEGGKYAEGFNFGPKLTDIIPVKEIAELIVKNYGSGTINIEKKDTLHEANLLMLDIDKAKSTLGWTPTYNIYQAIEKTVEWYKEFYEGGDILQFTFAQIKDFEKNMINKF